jgi:hypothetical protein
VPSTSSDERPLLVTVPTELGRENAARDVGIFVFSVLGAWMLMDNLGAPAWLVWPPVAAISLWALTGEPASDVGFIGGTAAALRHRFGMRRAHEWVGAYAHYFRLRVWPDWRDTCHRLSNSTRQRTIRLLRRLNGMTRWRPSRGSSWAAITRPNWSRKPEK